MKGILPPTYVEGFHDLEAVKSMEYNVLGKTGLLISKLSFGGGPLGCHYDDYDEDEAIATIRMAIRQGINYIDTAPWYGQGRSERTIGKALEGVPRGAYYIATKVGRYELDYENMFNFTAEKTRKSFNRSLELLQLDYVDVIQVHDIEFAPSLDIVVTQTLPELSKQVRKGNAKHIGITGYPISTLKKCIEQSNINIACVLTYARYTLLDDTLMQYLPFFKEHNIGVINGSAPCMRLLTNQGPPQWHPADDITKEQCRQAAQYCQEHNTELVRLAVWYSTQCTDIATNLIGIQNMKQLEMNMDIVRNGITDEEKALLQEIQMKYFSSIKGNHWEGKELEIYRAAIKAINYKLKSQISCYISHNNNNRNDKKANSEWHAEKNKHNGGRQNHQLESCSTYTSNWRLCLYLNALREKSTNFVYSIGPFSTDLTRWFILAGTF